MGCEVPVIVVLTKADALELVAIGKLREEGLSMKDAIPKAKSVAAQHLGNVQSRVRNQLDGCKYPPKAYVSLSSE